MPVPANSNHTGLVALLAEGVDRNSVYAAFAGACAAVALLAEGVDRNPVLPLSESAPQVALLAEGVDRNKRKYVASIY